MLVFFQCIKSVINILNLSPKHFVFRHQHRLNFRHQHQCHPFLERQNKSENCYGSRSKFAAKMCDDKLFQIRNRKEVLSFSAKLTWKWRNYIILNNCIKIFHFKYFYCDEIILILFSPLSKLIPQVRVKMWENFINILDLIVSWVQKCQKNFQSTKMSEIFQRVNAILFLELLGILVQENVPTFLYFGQVIFWHFCPLSPSGNNFLVFEPTVTHT